MHNFGVLAQVLLNGESRFLCLCDFKELGVAKRSRSTTSARPKLFQASRQDDRRFSDCTVLSFKFLTMQMQPSASWARDCGPFYPRPPCTQTSRTASDDLASSYRTRGWATRAANPCKTLRRSEFSQRKMSAAPYFVRRHLLF